MIDKVILQNYDQSKSAIVRKTNTIHVTIQTSNRVVYEIGGVTVEREAKLDDNVRSVVIPIITRPIRCNIINKIFIEYYMIILFVVDNSILI